MLLDAHCHLTDECYFKEGISSVIAEANQAGIGIMICSGYDSQSSIAAKNLAEQFDCVYFTAGYQPEELESFNEESFEIIKSLSTHKKCVAIGEIGLDYHFPNNPEKAFQKDVFIRHLNLANEMNLPVVIHSRDAAYDTLELLKNNINLIRNGGLMHCYSYSAEMVKDFSALGLYFSFGGTSTFKNAKKVIESVKKVPLDRILTETDCPYLTPEPLRGKFPNKPKNIVHILKNLSSLRELTEEEMEKIIYTNAKNIFPKLK